MISTMTKSEAEGILGLEGNYTRSDLRRAQGKKSRAYHPDVAEKNGLTKDKASELMLEVNNAYKFLLKLFSDDPDRVVSCGDVPSSDVFARPTVSYEARYDDSARASFSAEDFAVDDTVVEIYTDSEKQRAAEAKQRWESAKKGGFSQGASSVDPGAFAESSTSPASVEEGSASSLNEVIYQKTGVDPTGRKTPEEKEVEDLEYNIRKNPVFRILTSVPVCWIGSVLILMRVTREVGQFYNGWESHLLDNGFFSDPLAYLATILLFIITIIAIFFGGYIGPIVRELVVILAMIVASVGKLIGGSSHKQ